MTHKRLNIVESSTHESSTHVKFKTKKTFNTVGHAHFLTFSCVGKKHLFDEVASDFFLNRLPIVRKEFDFSLWAYVVMPTHAHVFIWPRKIEYDIAPILSALKGVMSKEYSDYLKVHDPALRDSLMVTARGRRMFRFWKRGGGYDRNVWDTRDVNGIIRYVESNPVRAGLVEKPEEWKWSSAAGRLGVLGNLVKPDEFWFWVMLCHALKRMAHPQCMIHPPWHTLNA